MMMVNDTERPVNENMFCCLCCTSDYSVVTARPTYTVTKKNATSSRILLEILINKKSSIYSSKY